MNDEQVQKLKLGAQGLGLELAQEQINLFIQYQDLLLRWNERMNLTSIAEKDFVALLFLDSLTPAKEFKFANNLSLIDIGSGGGFPGVPLAIAFPKISVTLLEATRKKIDFLTEVKSTLGLENVTILEGRAELLAKQQIYRETFDVVTARAVAKLPVLIELLAPFAKVGGSIIALKGSEADQEIEMALTFFSTLGLELDRVALINIPDTEINRAIVYLEKHASTPDKYPRSNIQAKKKPF